MVESEKSQVKFSSGGSGGGSKKFVSVPEKEYVNEEEIKSILPNKSNGVNY